MIPSKIYYTWFGYNEMDEKVRKNISGWKEKNPDFEIIQINETNFNLELNEFVKKAYNSKKWAFVSDVARLWALKQYGGFYLDTDVELLKPLRDLQVNKSVWALENSDAIASGLVIGAQAGDNHLKSILDLYNEIDFDDAHPGSYTTVGIVTKYFKTHGFKVKNKKQILTDETLILPTEYFAPLHYWGGGKVTKKTYAIHHYSATWVNDGDLQSWEKYGKVWLKKMMMLKVPMLLNALMRLKSRGK